MWVVVQNTSRLEMIVIRPGTLFAWLRATGRRGSGSEERVADAE